MIHRILSATLEICSGTFHLCWLTVEKNQSFRIQRYIWRFNDVLFFVSSQVPVLIPMDLMVEASPRRVFANAHTYHINSVSVNSDNETYLSADDLRINLWHLEITDRSFSILIHMWACFCLYMLGHVKLYSVCFKLNSLLSVIRFDLLKSVNLFILCQFTFTHKS